MDLTKELQENSMVLLVTSKEKYREQLMVFSRSVADSGAKKVCYVCFNEPFSSIAASLRKNAIPEDKFFFIDAITMKVQEPPLADNCLFVSSPNALTDISLATSKALSEQHCDAFIYDTLSTLLIYESAHSLFQFVHNTLTKFRVASCKAVFIVLKDDMNSELIKDLYMVVDKVIDTA